MKGFHSNNKILFIIFITVFLNMLGIGIIIPVIAPMMLDTSYPLLDPETSFSTRTILMGFLIAAFPLAQFFGSPILGTLSDKTGRKQILYLALTGTVAGYLLLITGIIMNILPLLFLGRIIDGLTGGNVSLIYSAIADVSGEHAKTKNFGLVGTAFGLGFVVGPFTGGILSDPEIISWFDYWTPFALASILIVINIILVWLYFPETLKQPKDQEVKWTQGVINIKKAFQLGATKYMLLVIFLSTFGFTFFTQFFQVYLIEKFEFRQSDIGQLFGYIGIWITISQGLITRIISKLIDSYRVLYISMTGLSFVFPILILPEEAYYLYFILPFVSIFQGINQPNMLSVLSNLGTEEDQGKILGVNQSMQSLAFAIPPIIAGFIVTLNINFPLIFAGLCVFLALILYAIKKPYR